MVASDSQASSELDYKRIDEVKLQDVMLRGAQAVIGGTGELRFTNRVAEIFREKAQDRVFSKPRQVADVAEEAVRYVVDRYFGEGPTRPDDDSKDFGMLLGVYCHEAWEIYVVDNEAVAANEPKYAATGSAEKVAEYRLSRMYRDHMDVGDALRTAVYVIEEVKRFDLFCGGKIQAYILKRTGTTRVADEDIKRITDYLAEKDDTYKRLWRVITMGPDAYDAFQQLILDEEKRRRRKTLESPKASDDTTPSDS